jgi:hypothetical protein
MSEKMDYGEMTMKNYLSIMSKFANMRAFDTANEGKPGADDAQKTAEADAKAAADAAAATAAVDDAQKAADAAATAASKSDDPKLQAAAAEKAELLREVMDKKEKLKAANKEVADVKKALEAFDGIDPVKAKELLKKEADADRLAAEAKGDFDRVKAMMVAEHEKSLKAVSDELAAERESRAADRSLIDELTIGNSFGNSVFIRDNLVISPVKTRTLYGSHFERVDGKVVAYDKPSGQKDRTMLVDAKGDALSFEEALSRIVDADPEKKGLLKSKVKPGALSASDLDKGKKEPAKVAGKNRIATNLVGLGE